jgi:hypothetical protein
MHGPQVFQFADRVSAVLVYGFGIFLQNARSGMSNQLGDEEVGHSCGTQATRKRVTEIVIQK